MHLAGFEPATSLSKWRIMSPLPSAPRPQMHYVQFITHKVDKNQYLCIFMTLEKVIIRSYYDKLRLLMAKLGLST